MPASAPLLYKPVGDRKTRLRFLGWDNFELDEHRLQLVIAHLEGSDFAGPSAEEASPD